MALALACKAHVRSKSAAPAAACTACPAHHRHLLLLLPPAQPLPQSTGCPRPPRHSWLPDLEPLAPTQPQPATQGGLLQPQPTPLGGLQPSASQQAGAGAGRGPCCQTPHYPSPRSYPGYAAGLLSPMAVPGLPQLDPAPTCHRLSGCTAASPRSAHPHHHHALCGLLSPGGLPPLPPGFLL